MELTIEKDEQQKLLDRRLIIGKVHFSEKAVPSRIAVMDKLASQLKIDKKLIVIKEIKTIFGSTTADLEAHVYNSVELKDKIEPKYLLKRNEIKVAEKKEKKEEAPAEEKKEEVKEAPKAEEKPVEEKKEEVKETPKAEEKPVEEKKEEVKEAPKKEEVKETPKAEEKPAEEKK